MGGWGEETGKGGREKKECDGHINVIKSWHCTCHVEMQIAHEKSGLNVMGVDETREEKSPVLGNVIRMWQVGKTDIPCSCFHTLQLLQ